MPGETKVWQYIALMRRIFVVDCPGVSSCPISNWFLEGSGVVKIMKIGGGGGGGGAKISDDSSFGDMSYSPREKYPFDSFTASLSSL